MRKRITQLLPFLTPIRVKQRIWCFYLKMNFDQNNYAVSVEEKSLSHLVTETKTKMLNNQSGQPMVYQHNKVHNLKLIGKTMNHIVINPGETFSFWKLADKHKKFGQYKDGLVLVDGKLTKAKGGGLCQLSNMLYYLFLQTNLTIVERVGHKLKSFPNPDADMIDGVDATVNEGWIDLKVKNETANIFQLVIEFDETYMYGKILANQKQPNYSLKNGKSIYQTENNQLYGYFDVIRVCEGKEKLLYNEKLKIDYPMEEENEKN